MSKRKFTEQQHQRVGSSLSEMNNDLLHLLFTLQKYYPVKAKFSNYIDKVLSHLSKLRSKLDDKYFLEHPNEETEKASRIYYPKRKPEANPFLQPKINMIQTKNRNEQNRRNNMIQLTKDGGDGMGMKTDIKEPAEFRQAFAYLLSDMIDNKKYDGDWFFQLSVWLGHFLEIGCSLKGYKADVEKKTLVITGAHYDGSETITIDNRDNVHYEPRVIKIPKNTKEKK